MGEARRLAELERRLERVERGRVRDRAIAVLTVAALSAIACEPPPAPTSLTLEAIELGGGDGSEHLYLSPSGLRIESGGRSAGLTLEELRFATEGEDGSVAVGREEIALGTATTRVAITSERVEVREGLASARLAIEGSDPLVWLSDAESRRASLSVTDGSPALGLTASGAVVAAAVTDETASISVGLGEHTRTYGAE